LWDSSGVAHGTSSYSTGVTYNKWNTYKVRFDLADLSLTTFTVNNVNKRDTSTAMSGSATIDFRDVMIRIGQSSAGVPSAHAEIRAPKLYAE